ncbi:hypothetical protein F9817_16195 [Vibrio sp. CAIM 722]|uniref:Uncharacterized protein n=1 Tax=Vibrio eleionomae TaxID=2653505 RepID=A0A7X4LN62_9VIBR|nr:hypothetical protein [Vibrio eleionomae]MZI94722.1 hypothetical protein [Vibrio eleionomae]
MAEWLPDLVLFEDYDGQWPPYLDAIYTFFEQDFVRNKPVYQGKRLGLKRYPEYEGKSATFWHMTSTGNEEDERIPDFRRCERIRWPKPVIENDQEPELKIWAEPKGKNQRIHIWYEDEGYLVVLDDRGEYILPWTAFYVEHEHQRTKYIKRWKRYTGQ